ncbi:MAG: hypothetical protein ACOC56_01665 [Atribacterota bacterium]
MKSKIEKYLNEKIDNDVWILQSKEKGEWVIPAPMKVWRSEMEATRHLRKLKDRENVRIVKYEPKFVTD